MSLKDSKCTWTDLCPSDAPSGEPSNSPSSLPSAGPSNNPSSEPSTSPTPLPSSMPSNEPSETPSSVPSDVPSNPPSNTTTNSAGRAAIAKTYDRMVLFGWSFDDISFSVYYTSWVTSLIIDASDAEGVANYIDSLDDISVNETGVVSEFVLPDYRDHNLIDARAHLYLPKTVKSICTRSENITDCRPVVCPVARGFNVQSTTRLTFAPSNTEILFGNDTTCSIKKPELWDSWIFDNFGENDTTISDEFYLPDPDGDGLSNIMEYWGLDLSFLFADIAPASQTTQSRRLGIGGFSFLLTGTDPNSFDTDDDLLSDYFERLYGLDPTTKDVIFQDSDGDGLTDFEEQKHGTSPLKEDTDNDGLSDFVEVGAGSDPLSNKEASSEPEISCPITLKVGDHSGSNSERWILEVGPIVHQATEFGKVQTETYNIPIGFHRVTVKHRDTNRLVGGVLTPDFDYTADISWEANPEWEITLEDPDNLLAVVSDSSKVDRTIGLEAYLTIKKIGGPSQLPCDYSTCESCNADSSCQWYSSRCSEWVQEYVEVKQPGVNPFATNEARRLNFFAGPTVPFIFHQGIGVQMYTVTTPVEKDSLEKCPTYKCNEMVDFVESNEPDWRGRLPLCPCKADRIFVGRTWPLSDYYTIEPKGGTDQGIDWSADRKCKSQNLRSCEGEHDRHKGGTFGCLEWEGDVGLPLPYTFYNGVQECCYDAQYNLLPYGDNRAGVTALDPNPDERALAVLSGGLLGGIGGVGVGVAIRLLLLDPDNNENFGAEFYNMCCGNTADSSGIAACNRYKGIVGGARGARGDDRQCMEKSCDETVFKNIGNRPSSPLVLDETVYDLSLQAHHLSNLVYEWPIPNTTSFTASYSSYTMDILGSWRSKNLVDQALVAKSNGRCFGIFRGTLGISSDPVAINDWISNFTPLDGGTAGKAWSCGGCGCCEGRANFVATLYNEFWEEFRETLLSCTQSCSDSTDCVVIGGHSQGGAIATIAANLDPWVFTFGQPLAMFKPCPYLKKLRIYRYINTYYNANIGFLRHDPVAMLPGLGSDPFGHTIFLGEDSSGVATKPGLDTDYPFDNLYDIFYSNSPVEDAVNAHSMVGSQSYFENLDNLHRYRTLFPNSSFPISLDGWSSGSPCLFDEQCRSNNCRRPAAPNGVRVKCYLPNQDIQNVYQSSCTYLVVVII